jgi:transcriptional regulator with XRE-family HTH domain
VNEKFNGKKLKQLRRKHKMTVRQVADAAGVTRAYIYALEAVGEDLARGPSFQVVAALAALFGVDVKEFLSAPRSSDSAGPARSRVAIPSLLAEAARKFSIPSADVRELAGFRFHGAMPRTVDDWGFLWSTVTRVVGGSRTPGS